MPGEPGDHGGLGERESRGARARALADGLLWLRAAVDEETLA